MSQYFSDDDDFSVKTFKAKCGKKRKIQHSDSIGNFEHSVKLTEETLHCSAQEVAVDKIATNSSKPLLSPMTIEKCEASINIVRDSVQCFTSTTTSSEVEVECKYSSGRDTNSVHSQHEYAPCKSEECLAMNDSRVKDEVDIECGVDLALLTIPAPPPKKMRLSALPVRFSSKSNQDSLNSAGCDTLTSSQSIESNVCADSASTSSSVGCAVVSPQKQSSILNFFGNILSRKTVEKKPIKDASQILMNACPDVESKDYTSQRKCPFYKWIPGTSFTVDAFRYGSVPQCTAYFLTHFHYDHYGGLTKKFRHPIYCNKITANLVQKKLAVSAAHLHIIKMNCPTKVKDVEVTFYDANHCPGAVIILFRLLSGETHLHTGDFRANTEMESYPGISPGAISSLFLDTTYCSPEYVFPPQAEVLQCVVNIAKRTVQRNDKTLVVCGSYTIGKEKVFVALSEALGCDVHVTSEKLAVLECLQDAALVQRLSRRPVATRLHVLPMGKLNYQKLEEYLSTLRPRFTSVLAFEPTGWSHSNKLPSLLNLTPKFSKACVTVYSLPYSEHSSYAELQRFVTYLKPRKIVATVNNGNPRQRAKMSAIFQQWTQSTAASKPKVAHQRIQNFFK